ncbi:hypothetical protein L3Q82_004503 [Scortum barcoo]|uniref:Uncharacterized protein n=1 Tax=Scortum barcoo TaxID=214431 RepID=A0ACB8VJM4_9TELE|nr:hypothetical protein L3Q82_004503 [Scortum barcoo]
MASLSPPLQPAGNIGSLLRKTDGLRKKKPKKSTKEPIKQKNTTTARREPEEARVELRRRGITVEEATPAEGSTFERELLGSCPKDIARQRTMSPRECGINSRVSRVIILLREKIPSTRESEYQIHKSQHGTRIGIAKF